MSHMPLWRGAVGAGDAGAVEHEGHAGLVQRDVHQHLVEGAVEERRVDRDDRVQPAEGHPGGGRRGVLLGDADVEHPLGERLGEGRRARPGASIAAVMPTTSGRSWPMATISSPKTDVQVGCRLARAAGRSRGR